ncbi:MAG TPA: tRNA (adenosine(37)-N6)-dimethylallyltransferase MiaA [Longimicrobiales bacterium]|nr:tRNA (adenosine(37)-N6)-dimethylallyltransferase MiaA [Longimicrobiales bacterium]
MSERPVALVLTGPTTSGKTDLSIEVANRLRGEIISMDSRQVYRGMDIGTDKVRPEDRAGIPHYGLDLVDPHQRYSAGQFARDARRWVGEIRSRGHVPVLAGGTGFFLRAVLQPMFREPEMDPVRLRRLRRWLRERDREELEAWVRRLDPERAELAAEGGPQRLSRTLEIPLLTGRPLSWWHRTAAEEAPGLPCCVVLLELPREELDRRIDDRVGRMVERGFLDEVRALLAAGVRSDDPGMTGTGYREVAAHLRGELDLDEALERMRLQTRQYARRQLTWFRNQLPDEVVRVDARLPLRDKARRIEDAWSAAQRGERG